MIKFKCTRCGKVVSGHDEHGAELAFNEHTCKGKRELSELPLPILKQLAMKEITEDEAWKLAAK